MALDVIFPFIIGPCLLFFAALCCNAGVIVTENVSPEAASWPGNPLIRMVTNPASQASTGESFTGAGGCTNYSRTFTVTGTGCTLQTIGIYAGGGIHFTDAVIGMQVRQDSLRFRPNQILSVFSKQQTVI